MKADDAQGRIIHLSFDVTLIPPQGVELGETDPAWDIGEGLVWEAIKFLKATGEAEGFKVEVATNQIVY